MLDPETLTARAIADVVAKHPHCPELRALLERGIESAPAGDDFAAKLRDAMPPAPPKS
jgi:hypothetical protein